jgi:hypothetical protein
MDPVSLATALMGAQSAQTQTMLAVQMAKMNARAEASVVSLLDAGQQNIASLANVSAGIGTHVNLSV